MLLKIKAWVYEASSWGRGVCEQDELRPTLGFTGPHARPRLDLRKTESDKTKLCQKMLYIPDMTRPLNTRIIIAQWLQNVRWAYYQGLLRVMFVLVCCCSLMFQGTTTSSCVFSFLGYWGELCAARLKRFESSVKCDKCLLRCHLSRFQGKLRNKSFNISLKCVM